MDPVRVSYGPRTGISNVLHILQDPYGTLAGPARVSYGVLRTRKGIYTTRICKNLRGRRMWPYGARAVPERVVHGLFMISKPVRGP